MAQIRREFAYNKRLTLSLFAYSVSTILAISYWFTIKIRQGDLWISGSSCGQSLLTNATLFIAIQELFLVTYLINLHHHVSHRRFFRILYGNTKFILAYHFIQLILLMASIININSHCSENSFASFFLILVSQTMLILVNLTFAMYYSIRVYRRIHDLVSKKGDKIIQEIKLDIGAIINAEIMDDNRPDFMRYLIAIGNEKYIEQSLAKNDKVEAHHYSDTSHGQPPKKIDESSLIDISDLNASF